MFARPDDCRVPTTQHHSLVAVVAFVVVSVVLVVSVVVWIDWIGFLHHVLDIAEL